MCSDLEFPACEQDARQGQARDDTYNVCIPALAPTDACGQADYAGPQPERRGSMGRRPSVCAIPALSVPGLANVSAHPNGPTVCKDCNKEGLSVDAVVIRPAHEIRRQQLVCFVLQGKTDAAKAKLYGRLGKMIVNAVRRGGPDAVANHALRDVLAKARTANLPREIIDRNIKSASDKNQADFQEVPLKALALSGNRRACACVDW